MELLRLHHLSRLFGIIGTNKIGGLILIADVRFLQFQFYSKILQKKPVNNKKKRSGFLLDSFFYGSIVFAIILIPPGSMVPLYGFIHYLLLPILLILKPNLVMRFARRSCNEFMGI